MAPYPPPHRPGPTKARRARILLATALAVLGTATGAACDTRDGETTTRQEAVADRGRAVMPFDLDATTHRFLPVPEGLIQSVLADDPTDATQVELVRSHLRAEAARFRRGDFDDPAKIHGTDMPGLASLRDHDGEIVITYRDIDGGGEIRYETRDPGLVDALHVWADAQTTDHGDHAEH